MALHASWVHGNALTVESPEVLGRIVNIGWGTELFMNASQTSWLHIPVPTPVLVDNRRAKLVKCFILFETEGTIDAVHIYDGKEAIARFDPVTRTGNHGAGLDDLNTFRLASPHSVQWGIGITFRFRSRPSAPIYSPPTRLMVASAGADFEV